MKLETVAPNALGSSALASAPASGTALAHAGAAPVPPAASTQPAPDAAAARQAAHRINEYLKASSANVEFTVDAESGQVVVRVVDAQSGELIRQMPSEEMLAISHALDRLSGLLLAQKA